MKLISLLFIISLNVFAHNAIVYDGPGACKEDCANAAMNAAKMAGLDPIFVTPDTFHPSVLEGVKVWVQPGGKSATASIAMGTEMRKHLTNFVKEGGGYVGFCAGAFLATEKVGTTRTPGLGIIPGKTKLYKKSPRGVSLQAFMTRAGLRHWYWEGGPRFIFSNDEFKKITVTGRYVVGNYIGAIETTFGKGRVSVTGLHPEAPQWWFDDAHIIDIDGSDNWEAANMIKWAANI